MTKRQSCCWQHSSCFRTRAECRHNRKFRRPIFGQVVERMWIRAIQAMQSHTSRALVQRSRLLSESMLSAAKSQAAYQRSLLCLLFTTFFLGVFLLRVLLLGKCSLRARTSSAGLIGRALPGKAHDYGVLYENVFLDKKTRSSVFGVVHMRQPRSFAGAVRLFSLRQLNSDNPGQTAFIAESGPATLTSTNRYS